MEFRKFNKLINTYNDEYIVKAKEDGLTDGQWVVTEKIDGANFSFLCDGEKVRVASRNQFVTDSFFNCQEVVEKYSDGILNFCKSNGITSLIIYGELFGDGIQNRVKYGKKDFIAFDVVLDGDPLSKASARSIAQMVDVPFAPILMIGDFDKCIEFNNTFKSHLTLEGYDGDNYSEGIVIEPVEPKFFNTGSRVYFKSKSERFSEKSKTRKLRANASAMSEESKNVFEEVLQYNNDNRVLSAISKIGEVTQKDFGKLLGMVILDIIEDYHNDTGSSLKDAVGDEWKSFITALNKEVANIVREHFLRNTHN